MRSKLVDALLSVAGKNCPGVAGNPDIPVNALQAETMTGLAIALTATSAFASATWAVAMAMQEGPWRFPIAAAIGLLWAAFVFTLDRALILSMARMRWPAVILRLVLAALIAVGISLPVDIAIFGDRLDLALLLKRQQAELLSQHNVANLRHVDEADGAVGNANAQVDRAQSAATQWPAEITALAVADHRCERELRGVKAHVESELREIDASRSTNRELMTSLSKAMPVLTDRLTPVADEARRLDARRALTQQQLAAATRRCDQAAQAVADAQRRYLADVAQQTHQAKEQLAAAQARQGEVARSVSEDDAKAHEIVERSLASGFIARAEALHELVWSDPYVRLVYSLILALWLLLEMAPILTKVLAGNSCIDVVLEAQDAVAAHAAQQQLRERIREDIIENAIQDAVLREVTELLERDPALAMPIVEARVKAIATLGEPRQLLQEMKNILDAIERERLRARRLEPKRAAAVLQALLDLERAVTERVAQALWRRGDQQADGDS